VFLNSHLLSELEMVCDEVAILVQGIVSAQGTIDDLTRDSRRYEIDVAPPERLAGREDHELFLPRALSGMAMLQPAPGDVGLNHAPREGPGLPGTALIKGTLSPTAPGEAPIPITIGNSNMTVGTDDAAKIQPLIDALRAKGCVIRAVKPVRASLEDLFMQAVTDPNTGQVLAPGASPDTRSKRGLFGRKGGRA
jgi:ABC-2 type transport system ATP-binding protein